MQAKDLPAHVVVDAVAATPGYWRTWEAVHANLELLMPDVPLKVLIRKVDAMAEVHACCTQGRRTCRGDVHLASECRGC